MSRTLESNAQALRESISTEDFEGGGVMPTTVFDDFQRQVIGGTPLLDAVRTETISSPKTRIPMFGVGERQRRGQAPGATGAKADVTSDHIEIEAEKGAVYWGLEREVVENYENGEELADYILDRMSDQFGVDTQELAVRGNEDSATGDADLDGFLRQNDGWIKIAQERGMATYSHVDGSGVSQPINDSVFAALRQEIDEKYVERSDPVYIMASAQLQEYREALSQQYDSAGFQVLMGDNDLTPFSYPVMAVPGWPTDKMMFTDPENLIYALFREVEVEVLRQSDETFDNDLYAKYALRAKDDFQVENVDAGALATDIAAPTPGI